MSGIEEAVHRRGEAKLAAIRGTGAYRMACSIAAGARLHGPKMDKAVRRGEWIPATQRYSTVTDCSVFRGGYKPK